MTQTMKEIIAVVIAIPLVITLCVLGVGGAGIVIKDWKDSREREQVRQHVEQEIKRDCRDIFEYGEHYRICKR